MSLALRAAISPLLAAVIPPICRMSLTGLVSRQAIYNAYYRHKGHYDNLQVKVIEVILAFHIRLPHFES
jgi:hypothetical protein